MPNNIQSLLPVTLPNIVNVIKKEGLDEQQRIIHGGRHEYIQMLIDKPNGKRPLGRSGHKCENIIKLRSGM